ncbi:hypothetical protein C0J52_26294 [Blattella germanica]|nr:hypothetical protein C0J52_26294 [Blattella germanica]
MVPHWVIVISHLSRCVLYADVYTALLATSNNILQMFMQNLTTGKHATFVGKCSKPDNTYTHIYYRLMEFVKED